MYYKLNFMETIPARDQRGTPILIFHDNGDWEISTLGQLDYMTSGSDSYAGYMLCIDILEEMSFAQSQPECIDENKEVVNVSFYVEIAEGKETTPVILLPYKRQDYDLIVIDTFAKAMEYVEKDTVYFNFIKFIDFFTDFKNFVISNLNNMRNDLNDDDIEPLYFDDDGDD